jgi:hypothetical protein
MDIERLVDFEPAALEASGAQIDAIIGRWPEYG